MISPAHSDVAFSLTKYYFGDVVASVIKSLFNFDQASLRTLRYTLPRIATKEIRRALLVLIKYQLVDYVKTVKNSSQLYEYSLVPARLFSFFSIPTFVSSIEIFEESIASSIMNSLTRKALLNRENLLQTTLNDLKGFEMQAGDCDVKARVSDMIENLVARRYLVSTSDNLCMNINKLNREHRDIIVMKTIYAHYNRDIKVKSIFKTVLDLSIENTADDATITAPVPLRDMMNNLVPRCFTDKINMENYLEKLTSESNNRFLLSSGVHPNKGPMYAINIGSVIDYLTREELSSMVTARYGPKCCRVFRVLQLKGPLLLKEIEEFIMLPARDVREYSYMLIKDGFIKNRQVPKTPDNAPGKSVFIMSVELDQLVYSATDICCYAITNLLTRYEFELNRNESLISRSKAVQKLMQSNDGADMDIDSWSQYFNSHELSQLDLVNRTLDKILLAKAQVEETLFLLHTWITLHPNFTLED